MRVPLPIKAAVCGGNGYALADTTDGLIPGCEAARVRPNPKLEAVAAGSDDAVSLLAVEVDPLEPDDSVGDDGVPPIEGGADVLMRLCEIVPIIVDELIKGAWSIRIDASERVVPRR